MNAHDTIYVGERHGYGQDYPLTLGGADRRNHLYVIGQTGTGKSTLLKNLFIQDILAGRGCGLIDPHGDLAREVLDFVPKHRINDVVYFNPGDVQYPIAWNLLHADDPERKDLVASGIVAAFKSVWHESWGQNLEYYLYAGVATMLEHPQGTLLGISRLLSDHLYRADVLRKVTDEGLRHFWIREFETRDKRSRSDAISPVLNRVGKLLLAPPVRNIFGQVKNKVTASDVMERGCIFIANLAKGTIGEDKANLIGALLVNQFKQAAMARATQPEGKRRDFFLSIDEFQSFATDSFASILSEARKYRLSLTLAHQYMQQLDPTVWAAVVGNVGTLLSFRVGESDAAILERQFGGTYQADTFTMLKNYQVCAKLISQGAHDEPFIGHTYPPLEDYRQGHRATIIKRSRQRYASRREDIEGKLNRWIRGEALA